MLNHAEIQGRLTHDPELKTTSGGTEYCRFALACDQDFSKEDGKRGVDFIDIIAWRQRAIFVSKWFHRGDQMVVSGRISCQSYEANDGTKRKKVEIVADNVYFGTSRRSQNKDDEEDAAPLPPMVELPDDTGLPF